MGVFFFNILSLVMEINEGLLFPQTTDNFNADDGNSMSNPAK